MAGKPIKEIQLRNGKIRLEELEMRKARRELTKDAIEIKLANKYGISKRQIHRVICGS